MAFSPQSNCHYAARCEKRGPISPAEAQASQPRHTLLGTSSMDIFYAIFNSIGHWQCNTLKISEPGPIGRETADCKVAAQASAIDFQKI
jgi:hypothetical protein